MTGSRWTEETVDLVARRLYFLFTNAPEHWWDELNPINQGIYRTKAKHLLTAMADEHLLMPKIQYQEQQWRVTGADHYFSSREEALRVRSLIEPEWRKYPLRTRTVTWFVDDANMETYWKEEPE